MRKKCLKKLIEDGAKGLNQFVEDHKEEFASHKTNEMKSPVPNKKVKDE